MKSTIVILILACLGLVKTASAMDRWSALSMLESGNSDFAVGACGEISRFQIEPRFWPGGNPANSQLALTVAQTIMRSRLTEFQQRHGREATDFEFYVLWNAPWQANHPSAVVTERAQRFANLVELVRR
jgi:hypothetical protein